MRQSISLAALCGTLAACTSGSGTTSDAGRGGAGASSASGGSGGSTGSGGANGSGGATTGGATGSGGGATGAGGAIGTGGAGGGGTTGSGGSAIGTGGAGGSATTGTAGATGKAGANGTGGTPAVGGASGTAGQGGAGGATMGCAVLNPDQILAAQGLQEPQWYKDNVPFVDTPDANINGVYYYRWSTHKRALRYTAAGAGYIATEYDNPVWYSGANSYSGLPDAAGYHILDGRWLRNATYMDDYINYWVRGAGVATSRSYSEWITAAAYQRYLVTGDATLLKANLSQFISHYNMWGSNLTANISVNGTSTTDSLYFQSPLSDATEYTETSFRSTDAFGGGAGFRPTINSYQYANAQALSKIATLAGDSANATSFANRAASLKAAVQHSLWDPQRQFFMHVYNSDSTNSGIAGTRTTWREAMGFAPWAFELPDATYSSAWQYLTDPQRFAGPDGFYTLERITDFEAEQAVLAAATVSTAASASNGQYVGGDRRLR